MTSITSDAVRALDAGEPELFATYARWLASVLEPRGGSVCGPGRGREA